MKNLLKVSVLGLSCLMAASSFAATSSVTLINQSNHSITVQSMPGGSADFVQATPQYVVIKTGSQQVFTMDLLSPGGSSGSLVVNNGSEQGCDINLNADFPLTDHSDYLTTTCNKDWVSILQGSGRTELGTVTFH